MPALRDSRIAAEDAVNIQEQDPADALERLAELIRSAGKAEKNRANQAGPELKKASPGRQVHSRHD